MAQEHRQHPERPSPTGYELLTELGQRGWFIYVIGVDVVVDEEASESVRRIAVGATKLGQRIEEIGETAEEAAPEVYRQAMAA